MKNISEVNQQREKVYRLLANLFKEVKKYSKGYVDEFSMPIGHIPDSPLLLGNEFEIADTKVENENKTKATCGYLSSLVWALFIPDKEYEEEFNKLGEWLEVKSFSEKPTLIKGASLRNSKEIEKQIQKLGKYFQSNLNDIIIWVEKVKKSGELIYPYHEEYFRRQIYSEYWGRIYALLWILEKPKSEIIKYLEKELGPYGLLKNPLKNLKI